MRLFTLDYVKPIRNERIRSLFYLKEIVQSMDLGGRNVWIFSPSL